MVVDWEGDRLGKLADDGTVGPRTSHKVLCDGNIKCKPSARVAWCLDDQFRDN